MKKILIVLKPEQILSAKEYFSPISNEYEFIYALTRAEAENLIKSVNAVVIGFGIRYNEHSSPAYTSLNTFLLAMNAIQHKIPHLIVGKNSNFLAEIAMNNDTLLQDCIKISENFFDEELNQNDFLAEAHMTYQEMICKVEPSRIWSKTLELLKSFYGL